MEPEKAKEGDLVQDKGLTPKLEAELPGILNWAIQGCLQWQKHGLREPDRVRVATQAYRLESDTLGRFLKQETVREQGEEVGASELYEVYKVWCEAENEKSMSQTMFGRKLAEKGYVKKRKPRMTYIGLKLLNPSPSE